MKPHKELRCCKGCGRDTREDYCHKCVGHARDLPGKGRGYVPRIDDLPLEDDYSEESDADSVCQDDSRSTVLLNRRSGVS